MITEKCSALVKKVNMKYEHVIRDFANRTCKNLEYIDNCREDPDIEVYEVTQLINSMLGLLVFPQQRFFNSIPETPLGELETQGWPRIEPTPKIQASEYFKPCTILRELVRVLHHTIAHFNIEFLSKKSGEISGIRIWNIDPRKGDRPKTWEAEISIETLCRITELFIESPEPENIS